MPDTQISDAIGLIDGGLQLLLAAVHADDPKREMLFRVGDLLRDVRSLEAALSGHVVVPFIPTPEMQLEGARSIGKTASVPNHLPRAADCYRAMIKAAPPVASGHVVGWRTMDSAPKDGTWILAYRPSSVIGVQATLVAVCWDQESNDFVWPTEIFDVYNPPDLSAHDERGFLEVDVYESQGSFTHWQPLPAPPVPVEPNPTAGAS